MEETKEQKPKKKHRYDTQKCLRINKNDLAVIRNAYDHTVRRRGIKHDGGGLYTENDWMVHAIRMAAKREMGRSIRDEADRK